MDAKNLIAATAVLATAVALGLSGQASAADLPTTKGPPPPPPVEAFSWTGPYVGGHIGGAWDYDQFHFSPLDTGSHDGAANVFGGAQAGFNYQISPIVLGVEGDISGTYLSSSAACLNPAFVTCGHNIDWLASLRARAGFIPFDRVLVYATGGAALTDPHYTVSPPGVAPNGFSGSFDDTRVGWAVGGGVEYAFTKNWSVKVEDIYYGFRNTAQPGSLSAKDTTVVTTYINTIDVGVNYHF